MYAIGGNLKPDGQRMTVMVLAGEFRGVRLTVTNYHENDGGKQSAINCLWHNHEPAMYAITPEIGEATFVPMEDIQVRLDFWSARLTKFPAPIG